MFCGKLCDNGEIRFICGDCYSVFAAFDSGRCIKCGKPRFGKNSLCAKCSHTQFSCGRAYHAYGLCDKTRFLVHQFKYSKNFEAAQAITGLMDKKGLLSAISSDIIVPVPMHIIDKLKRGFNHSAFLAKMVSKITGVPVVEALAKIKATPHQVGLTRTKRIKNIKNAFKAVKAGRIKGRKILLFDDICTTGATLNECAIALKKAEVGSIEIMTFAVTAADSSF
ncbi:MAG: ComF family protein [Candidatus Aureabacteria bacterium]|nr:ComF family protein [Candidatus Auribacterota bacterium]